MADPTFPIESVALRDLKPHPRNYQTHPDDEREHIKASITEHGLYRNVVIARDGTLLAGHGVVEAATELGLTMIPVFRTPYAPNDPKALKILAGDNEIRHLAEVDDRALTELLKEVAEADDLLGTGYDEMMLANLVMVSRHASEIEDLDAAAQWVGLPEYQDKGEDQIRLTVHFINEDDQREFCRVLGIGSDAIQTRGATKYLWWPNPHVYDDSRAIRFTDQDEDTDA